MPHYRSDSLQRRSTSSGPSMMVFFAAAPCRQCENPENPGFDRIGRDPKAVRIMAVADFHWFSARRLPPFWARAAASGGRRQRWHGSRGRRQWRSRRQHQQSWHFGWIIGGVQCHGCWRRRRLLQREWWDRSNGPERSIGRWREPVELRWCGRRVCHWRWTWEQRWQWSQHGCQRLSCRRRRRSRLGGGVDQQFAKG